MKKISSFLFMLLAAMTMNAKTLYCQMPYSWWWNGDGEGHQAAISLYAYGEGETKNAEFPGQQMTEIDSENHIWSIDIDLTGYTSIIFARSCRVPENWNWGAQTNDLPVSEIEDNDLYIISASEPAWIGDGNACAGSWSVYSSTPVEKNTYHIYVTNNTGWDVFYMYEYGTPNEITGGWPGAQGSGFEFSVAEGINPEMHLIFHNNVGEGQPGDLRQYFDITEARDYYLTVTAEGVSEGQGGGQGIDRIVNGDSSNRKMMKDGQLVIIRDGKTYNALGTELR